MFKKSTPSISVCIPVYNSEQYLEACLESVAHQTFKDFELVIVNDCSPAQNSEGLTCKSILNKFKSKYKIPVNYIEHSKNKGLLETRRTAVIEARGKYIAALDSDDMFTPTALENLYQTALSTGADIVHGFSRSAVIENGNIEYTKKNKNGLIYIGTLENQQILDIWLVLDKCTDSLWGKLIDRELYLNALENIPETCCNLGEDVIQYFFITLAAKKYVGIQNHTIIYRITSGMTADKPITTLKEWEMHCSSASIFTIMYLWLENQLKKNGRYPISKIQYMRIQTISRFYLRKNLQTLENRVAAELKDGAMKMLKDYWGNDFVENTQNKLKEQQNS